MEEAEEMNEVYIAADELRELSIEEVFAKLGARMLSHAVGGPRVRSLGEGAATVSLRKDVGGMVDLLYREMETMWNPRQDWHDEWTLP